MAGIQYKDETLEVGNIRAGTITTLPDYAVVERDRVYDELLERVNKEVAILAFNTDQHIDTAAPENWGNHPRYVLNGIRALRDIAELIPIDIICLGGDTCGWLSTSVRDIFDTVNIVNQPLSNIKTPVVSIPGNHDGGQNNTSVVGQGMYNVHTKRLQFESYWHKYNGIDTGCGYIDDALHKIRYAFVDTGTRYGKTTSIWDFVPNSINTLPNDYKIIFFSHHPLTNEFNGVVMVEDSNGNQTNAFQDCTAVAPARINQHAEKVIACINGHGHVDAYGVNSSGILFIQTTCAAPHTRVNHFGSIPNNCTLGTATDTSYDIFVVDQNEQTIEALRYGQGSNRKWYYKGDNTGLIGNYNNLIGTCSVPSVTLNFTDGDNNVINAVVGSDGTYNVYLELAKTYTISCDGYSLSTNSVTLSRNTTLNLTLTAN